MNERDGEKMIEELVQVYRRYLRGAGVANQTIVVLVEDLRDHVTESIRSEVGWEETPPEACPGCGRMPGDGSNPACDHPQGCGFFRRITP